MSRNNARRERIERALADFRQAASTLLGAAEAEHAAAVRRHRGLEFAVELTRRGIEESASDPEVRELLKNRVFADILRQARAERTRAFADWTGRGPRELVELTSAAAPGAAGAEGTDWLGPIGRADGTQSPPELWRIGTARFAQTPVREDFPAAVPLLDAAHLFLTSTETGRAGAESLVETLLLRLLSFFRPGLVHLGIWDISKLTGSLPGLYPLTKAGILTAHDPARLDGMLEELGDHIRRIHTSVLVDGHPSLASVTRLAGRRTEPWRVAVLFGNGQPLPEQQQLRLERIARNGLACGVTLILLDVPLSVGTSLESVHVYGEATADSSMSPSARITLDPPLPRAQVTAACGAIAAEYLSTKVRVRDFDDLLPERLWQSTSHKGLTTPIGFADGEPVEVTLGDSSPHALIGGPSGSGKTNLLYALIGGMCARYSPDELEFYLLDFKEGVSFAQFVPGRKDPSWLPHARLVGVNVNADREFGLALLRFLAEEMRRRADAAKRHEVTKLEELRAEDPSGRWPRIVAVIDEFQFLFAERDTVTAKAVGLLEDVARRGRSQGIHLVLASQDVSGIEAFWGRPAIFEQFSVRIALPKARRVLSETNPAALEIPRWHGVINHDSGVRHGNRVARIPDSTSKGTFEALQHQLWQRRVSDLSPTLFDGGHEPVLATTPEYRKLSAVDGPPTVLLGQVIDVAGTAAKVRLAHTPGRNVAVIGSATEDACGVLTCAGLSLGAQYRPGTARFTLAALAESARGPVDRLAAALSDHQPRIVDLAGFPDLVTEPISGDQPHFVLVYAVDAAQSMLEEKIPGTRITGLERLRGLLKNGPENRTHVIGWWRSAARLKTTLGLGPADEIGAWLAFDAQGSELHQFASGQIIHWSPRPRRALMYDRFDHPRPEVVIPFDLTGTTDATRTTDATGTRA